MYFTRFPKIVYNEQQITNILSRVKILDSLESYATVFLPYTVEEGERPSDVANFYYDDPQLDWLVLLSNQIIDPYFEWPLSTNEFLAFIRKKYGTLAAAQSQVSYYQHNTKSKLTITPDTYALMSGGHGNYTAVTAYDMENEKNENQRIIQLLDKSYKSIALRDLKRILNGG